MSSMEFVYKDGNFSGGFRFPATQAQEHELHKEIGANIRASEATLNAKGISLHLAGDTGASMFIFEPIGWGLFWDEENLSLSGVAACLVWLGWLEFVDNHNANLVVQQIKDGEIGFPDIKALNEQLLHHNIVQSELSNAVADGTIGDKLKARQRGMGSLTPEIWELYNWASWICISGENENWDSACYKACRDHKELVPLHWINPEAALKKAANRYMNKHPLLHQPTKKDR